jgi:DnaJ-class molecular chaperone
MEQIDYYKTLGVREDADSKQIKTAYRKLAFKYHPDRNKENPGAAENMKRVNEAYAVLSSPEKRREYDALRQRFGSSAHTRFRQNYSDQDIFSGSDIHQIFEEMSRAFGLRGFEDIFRNVYFKSGRGKGRRNFEYKGPGFHAKGFFFSGTFGPSDLNRMQLPLKGAIGILTRYLFKQIGGGYGLPQDGGDSQDTIGLTPSQARQGGPYAYFHRKKSKKLVVRIPPGVRDGQQIRLSAMGEEGKAGGKPGDLYLKVRIKTPLLDKVKDAVARFRN